jgi:hypothetical protein
VSEADIKAGHRGPAPQNAALAQGGGMIVKLGRSFTNFTLRISRKLLPNKIGAVKLTLSHWPLPNETMVKSKAPWLKN